MLEMNTMKLQAIAVSLLAVAAALPMNAQAPAAGANPVSTWLRGAHTGNKNNILRTAEEMPEENYGMRPGAQQEVRSFAAQLAHVARFNYLWCSQAKGEKNPIAGTDPEKLTGKAEVVKLLTDAFAYCDSAYEALTDASGAEIIEITQENGRTTRNPRMGLLTLNYGHNNEIYGGMVIFLRMKNIVPPASEPRTPAAAGKK